MALNNTIYINKIILFAVNMAKAGYKKLDNILRPNNK